MSDPSIPPSDPTPPTPPASSVPPSMDYATPPPVGTFMAPLGPMEIVTDPLLRQWGLIAHLSALSGVLIPFGNIVGPLIVWQMKKEEMPFAADQAKEALNFHITTTIMLLVSIALICVVIGMFLAPLVGIYALVMTIIGAVAANNGKHYRYPMTIRMVK